MLTRLRKWTSRKSKRGRKHGARHNNSGSGGCDNDGDRLASKCSKQSHVDQHNHKEQEWVDDNGAASPLELLNSACKQPEPQLSQETLESIIRSANALASRTRSSNRSSVYDDLSSIVPAQGASSNQRTDSSHGNANNTAYEARASFCTSAHSLYSQPSNRPSYGLNPPSSFTTLVALDAPKTSAPRPGERLGFDSHDNSNNDDNGDSVCAAAMCNAATHKQDSGNSCHEDTVDGSVNDGNASDNSSAMHGSDFVTVRLQELAELERRWQALFDKMVQAHACDARSRDNAEAKRHKHNSHDHSSSGRNRCNSPHSAQSGSRNTTGRASLGSVFTFDEEEVERESRRASECGLDDTTTAVSPRHDNHQHLQCPGSGCSSGGGGAGGGVVRRSSSKRHRPRRSSPLAISARSAANSTSPMNVAESSPAASPRCRRGNQKNRLSDI